MSDYEDYDCSDDDDSMNVGNSDEFKENESSNYEDDDDDEENDYENENDEESDEYQGNEGSNFDEENEGTEGSNSDDENEETDDTLNEDSDDFENNSDEEEDFLYSDNNTSSELKSLSEVPKLKPMEADNSIIIELLGSNNYNNWKKGEKIGVGGFSDVFLANVDTPKGCFEIVVKEIKATHEAALKNKKSAETEINILKSLSHERIVNYYGFMSDNFAFSIFMEHVECGSLCKYIQENTPLSDDTLKLFARQILQGLEYLHSKRTIHRDIKSSNVLLSDKNNIKLADFGVSKIFGEISKATTQGVGTIIYRAPEMFKLNGHGYPVDIWSTGCVVLEMATGKFPFSDITQEQVLGILIGKNPSPMPYCADFKFEPEIESFLSKIFKKDQSQRPTCTELLSDVFFKAFSDATNDEYQSVDSAGNSGSQIILELKNCSNEIMKDVDSEEKINILSPEMKRPKLDQAPQSIGVQEKHHFKKKSQLGEHRRTRLWSCFDIRMNRRAALL